MTIFTRCNAKISHSIPRITIQLLLFEPTNAHSSLKSQNYKHISCYMFRATLALLQGAHSCTEYLHNVGAGCNAVTVIKLCAFVGYKSNNSYTEICI